MEKENDKGNVQLPSGPEALRMFFRYPTHPGNNASEEELSAYNKRVAEIDARLEVLSNPDADQEGVKQIRDVLAGGKID
jgi:hypothetical protein